MQAVRFSGHGDADVLRLVDLPMPRPGADAVVSYANPDWVQQVRQATDGRGVAASFDAVGGRVGTEALLALGAGGTAVIYGAASGEPTKLDAQ